MLLRNKSREKKYNTFVDSAIFFLIVVNKNQSWSIKNYTIQYGQMWIVVAYEKQNVFIGNPVIFLKNGKSATKR